MFDAIVQLLTSWISNDRRATQKVADAGENYLLPVFLVIGVVALLVLAMMLLR
jgi:hypothetical protein